MKRLSKKDIERLIIRYEVTIDNLRVKISNNNDERFEAFLDGHLSCCGTVIEDLKELIS